MSTESNLYEKIKEMDEPFVCFRGRIVGSSKFIQLFNFVTF